MKYFLSWFDLKGRIGRLSFFLRVLAMTGLYYLFSGVFIVALNFGWVENDVLLMAFVIVNVLVCYTLMICASVKRFHDLGFPTNKVVIMVIPAMNLYWFLKLLADPGMKDANPYGPSILLK